MGLVKMNFKSNGHLYVGNMLCKISYCVCHLSNQSLSFKPPTFFLNNLFWNIMCMQQPGETKF